MIAATDAREADWLEAARRATEALREILNDAPTTAERVRETGTRGKGGDSTLVIDAAAEDAVFAELDRLHAEGYRFSAVSEERGVVDYGGAGGFPLVVIDPIDGSLNAKRRIPSHSISIAVADGPTMGDVFFGYVYDFGPDEEWVGYRGAGATLDGVRLTTEPGERRTRDGRLEVLGIESADPRWLAQAADALVETAHRVRAMGTIAVSLCQVAGARFDAMATLKGCRAVDAADGQLIVLEAGGHVAFTGYREPLGAPLDLVPHSALVAARTRQGLADVSRVPQMPRA
jgi:myo-inositol-1(or 4)-monophosphatase